ncbi:MAG: tetratricopeptide repeat protein [Elusimicrobiota bacterium]
MPLENKFTKQSKCTDLIKKGLKVFAEDQLKDAVKFLNEALKYAKDNRTKSVINFYLGNMFQKDGNYNLAIKYYQRCSISFPQKTNPAAAPVGTINAACVKLALIYSELGDWQKSAEHFLKATNVQLPIVKIEESSLDNQINSNENYLALGITNYEQGNYVFAKRCLKRAIETYPNNFGVFNALANVCDALGKYEEAQKYYIAGLKIKPDCYYLLGNRGVSFYFQGNLGAALLLLEKSLSTMPVGWLYYWLYKVYAEIGNEMLANNAYFAGVATSKQGMEFFAKADLARFYSEKNENLAEAEKLAIESLQTNKYFGYYCLGRVYLAQNEPEKAAVAIKASLLLNPNYFWSLFYLGLIYKHQFHNIPESNKFFYKILENNPRNRFVISELKCNEKDIVNAEK